MARRFVVLATVLAASLVASGKGQASQLIDRNATDVRVAVDSAGEALLTYRSYGLSKQVLAWGAINALAPGVTARQVRFQLDYAGGWGRYRNGNYWRSFADSCRPYMGPSIPYFLAGCTAPDGSYWAAQGFPQPLPDLGYTPWTRDQQAVWLELSHWSGPLARLDVWQGWIYDHRYNEIYGRVTYRGNAVYGFGTTNRGAPTDGFGRLVYLDTLDSPAYGPGWRRENSFVSHNPTGAFCYGFYPFNPTIGGYDFPPGQTAIRGPGVGTRYRITVQGPGVTPDVAWEGPALGHFEPGTADRQLEESQLSILHSLADRPCLRGLG